ncbi:MAG: T9SS type A sorting domain-containing protein [Ignavibacteriaceae bacterium]
MTKRKFLLLTFILFIASVYSIAQIHNEEAADRNNFISNNHFSENKAVQKIPVSNETETDTIYPSFIKEDFIVNSFAGEFGADQIHAAAAIDGKGNYAVAWLDYRNERTDIYIQFFNSNDEKTGPNIKVNQQDADLYNPPSIAANRNGDFVIAWRQDYNTIEARGFNIAGRKIDSNFSINITAFSEPSVAVIDNGSFLICWNGDNITAELFDRRGNLIKKGILINESGTFNSGFVPGKNVANDNKGNFYIVWCNYENDILPKIYLQVIDSTGRKVNNNIVVSGVKNSKNSPRIASANDGNFLIAWDYSSSYNNTYTSGIKIRIYNSEGYFVTNEISIDHSPDNVLSGGDSTFFLSYLNVDEQGHQQKYIQRVNTKGKVLEKKELKFNTNKDLLITGIDLTNAVNDHFIIVPEFKERDDANIYVQKFNTDLEAVGTFTEVHDDSGSAYQLKPMVKFNNKGESIVLWEDKRNGRFDLYGQLYDMDFNPVGNNIMIDETDAELLTLVDKKVQCLSDGTFVIAYSYYEDNNYNNKVFLRLINKDYSGENVQLKDEQIYSNLKLALNINSRDEILVCFYSDINAYLRKYDKKLNPVSPQIKFIQYQYININLINFYIGAVSIDTAFNIMAAGRLSGSGISKIAGKFFNQTGEETSNFVIAENSSLSYSGIKCANDNGSYAVIYNDYYNVYIKRRYFLDREYFINTEFTIQGNTYNSSLNLVEFNNQKILVTFNSFPDVMAAFINDNKREIKLSKLHTYSYSSQTDYNTQNFVNNYADFYNDRLFFTYENGNPGTGYDIQANVQNIDSINFNKETFLVFPAEDALLDNYPNPFNSRTRITYKLAAYHKVKLTIYDILGREVKVLVDRYEDRGTYEVDFNASGLASGIYIYRLDAFDTIVKKMILLK